MKPKLSRVYLDDRPVRLMGDESRPHLSRIVRAGGKRPGDVEVRWLESPTDPKGLRLEEDEVLDRTLQPTKPIYLRSVARSGARQEPEAAQPVRPRLFRGPLARSEQLEAELEAEQRREDQRNAEDSMQDEMEAIDDQDDGT